MDAAEEIDVWSGLPYRTANDGFIGGVNGYLDDDGKPVMILYLRGKDEESGRDLDLRAGDTFAIGPEEWKVVEILGGGTYEDGGVRVVRLK